VFATERVPLVELSFAYGERVVSAREDDDGARDGAQEDEARRLLESFGLVPLECLEDWAASAAADYAVRCDGTVHDFCAFSAYVVPQLRELGWRVSIDAAYPYRIVEREPVFYAHVEADAERRDWFGLELGIELDGVRVNLLPALLALLERWSGDLAQLAKRCVAIPVADGLYLPIPAERARALLRVVAELYDPRAAAFGRLSFPKLRGGALIRLAEVLAAEGGRFVTSGDGRPRAFAEAVVEANAAAAVPDGLRADLRPYQLEGLRWLANLRARGVGGILADDMGLGKTLQTIAHLLVEKREGRLENPALIVAPTSLVSNWERELARFAPFLRVVVLHGSDRHAAYARAREADVLVTSYPLLCRDEDKLAEIECSTVILDEAQTVKNMRSRAHAAARSIRATHRLCLSGTPVENHLGELWALVDFVNPGLLGDELHFGRFYRVPIEKQHDRDRLQALRDVVAPYILRRNKRDVLRELPPKTEVLRPVELRGAQRELYEGIRVAAHGEVRRLIKKRGLAASTIPILGALTKLRQVCCDPRLVRMGSANVVRESAKYEMFFELVQKQLDGDHRLLVFSQFTSMLALLARGLDERRVSYSMLTGDTADRAGAVDRFERGDARVFLISLRAGGTGLTLTSADVVIHYDPWWNPAVQAQATDRAYRIGQTRPVISYHLFAAGSVEERILGLQREKQNVADAILGEGSATATWTEEEIDVLFAPLGA
jgi:superfamily II DNA or RNA helicase